MIFNKTTLITLKFLAIPLLINNLNIICSDLSLDAFEKLMLCCKNIIPTIGLLVLNTQLKYPRIKGCILSSILLVLMAEYYSLHNRGNISIISETAYLSALLLMFYVINQWLKSADLNYKKLQLERDKFKTLSSSDSLTELKNRRSFEEVLSNSPNSEITLMLIDIDDFKKINDLHGHQGGDEYLKHFASILMQSTRGNDNVFRIGGEEFSILISGSSIKAEIVAERILKKTRSSSISFNSKGISTTCSIGIAKLNKTSITESVKEADNYLYFVKNNGKNNYKAF